MNTLLKMGTRIVVLALISYSIAIFSEQRNRLVSNLVLVFISLGVVLDITATAFMILGSSNTPFTLHGILGYSSLVAMCTDAILLWRHRIKNGPGQRVKKSLHMYSRCAYIWWVLAFVTGATLVFVKYLQAGS